MLKFQYLIAESIGRGQQAKGLLPASENVQYLIAESIGSVHNSSRDNLLAQKRVCRVENARKVSNLAALFALQARFCAQNLTRG
jgi:hypothetical protein